MGFTADRTYHIVLYVRVAQHQRAQVCVTVCVSLLVYVGRGQPVRLEFSSKLLFSFDVGSRLGWACVVIYFGQQKAPGHV